MKRVITYGTFDVLHYGHIKGKSDFLKDYCEVVYLPRTPDVCSTNTKSYLADKELSKTEEN